MAALFRSELSARCLHHKAGEAAEGDVTPPPPNKSSAAVCFVSARAPLLETSFVSSKIPAVFLYKSVVCTAAGSRGESLNYSSNEFRTFVPILSFEETGRQRARWKFHLWRGNNKCHQNRFQIHLDRSGNLIDTAHPVLSCVFHPFQCNNPSTAAGINRIALDSSRYSRCCGLLTIDPFGLRVVSLELCLEQILHSQLGVAPSLGVNCKKTSIFFLVFSIIKHRFCRAGQFAFQHAHRWKSISGISWPWLSLLPLAFQCFPRYRSIKSQTSKHWAGLSRHPGETLACVCMCQREVQLSGGYYERYKLMPQDTTGRF